MRFFSNGSRIRPVLLRSRKYHKLIPVLLMAERGQGRHFEAFDVNLEHPNDIDGLNLIRALSIRFPDSKILVLSAHYNPATVALALRAGAHGFVGKNQPLSELVGAIRTVSRGQLYLAPDLTVEFAYLLSDVAVQDVNPVDALSAIAEDPLIHRTDLSPGEREVLRCCLNGMSVTQIAEQFGRSIKTISTQKHAAFRKLGIRTDNELFKMHHQLGML